MRKLLSLLILSFILDLPLFSQCDPRLIMKIPENPDHFIKSFAAFMPDENDTILKYTLLLHEGMNYKIEIFETDEFIGGASYSLYEGNKLIGTNFTEGSGKSHPSFNFKCQKSLSYDIIVRKMKKGKYCASWVIQEVKDSGESYFDFSGANKGTEKVNFVVVEDMPEFIAGKGIESFKNWIQQNLVYPEEALKKRISGKIYVTFVVDEKGDVVDVKIVRGVGPILDKAALDLIKSSPRWEKPGMQRGKKVRVAFTFPIAYVLKPEKKEK